MTPNLGRVASTPRPHSKDIAITDIPTEGWPADSEAGLTAHLTFDTDPAVTTDHLRRLWEAGGRSITVTYDAATVRHRAYLAHPRTEI